ncbi:MAG: FAD-binding oxidoreductase [Pseudomonadota bacterium]
MDLDCAEIIVIGGGIVGSSIAYRLAEKGCSVLLLEKGRVGEEASGRCGGGVRQQDRDPVEIPLAREAIKIWADMKDELDCDVGYRRGGNINLALSEQRLEILRHRAERETRLGLEVEMLPPEDARRLTPLLSTEVELFGSKHCPSDGTANPLLVVKAICRAARRRGVRIHEYNPVRGFKTQGNRVTAAVTENGEYGGDVFVNAAGPWAKGLCHLVGLDMPIIMKKEAIMVTEPLPPLVRQFVQTEMLYFRQALEGNFHLAGDITSRPIADFDKSVDFDFFVQIGRWAPHYLPFLRNVNIIRAFTGIIHSTPDKLPILDQAPGFENLFLTAGFSGHGFCLGPIVGRLMAEWIVDGKPSLDLSGFGQGRFRC